MAEIDKNYTKIKWVPNATIITNMLPYYPNVDYFFKTMIKDTPIVAKHVGRSYRYHNDVNKSSYYFSHEYFMDYFIKKYLSNLYNMEITDMRTERILEKRNDKYKASLYDSIKEHYEIFKDSKTQALDIIKSIKIVSLSHLIYFEDSVPRCDYTVNEDNLREIIRYLKQLPYKMVDLNPKLSCDYFQADADLIFDNKVIYEIKTSKYKSLTYNEPKIPLSKFYLPIIYGFGFYKKTGIKVKQFKIYNPLLGDEFSIELNNIDFELFEKVLRHDVALNNNVMVLMREAKSLDLSLFDGEAQENEKQVVHSAF